jgi:hypothetical protein
MNTISLYHTGTPHSYRARSRDDTTGPDDRSRSAPEPPKIGTIAAFRSGEAPSSQNADKRGTAQGEEARVTNPAELDPQQRNQFMLNKIRTDGTAPYQEGKYVLRVVSVPGRSSGEPRTVPIAIPMVDGERYLCAPNRQRDWVRNLLAAGECEVEGDAVARNKAVLIEDETAATVVHTYISGLGRQSTMWPFAGDAPASEIANHLAEIAVFRLDSVPG